MEKSTRGRVVAVAVVVVAAVALIVDRVDAGPSPDELQAEAVEMCEQAVVAQLESPDTAVFWQHNAARDGAVWRVAGLVDETALGLRSTWTCTASHDGSRWGDVTAEVRVPPGI